MEFEFVAEDLTGLSAGHMRALLHALFLAAGVGREFGDDDVQRFRDAVAKLPTQVDPQALQAIQDEAKVRYESSGPPDFTVWVGEIATQITGAPLREKILLTMGRVAFDDTVAGEPGTVGAAIDAFQIAPDRLALIQQILKAEFSHLKPPGT